MYVDYIKLFAKKNKKELETLIQTIRIYSQYNEKRKKTNNVRNRTAKSRKNQNAWRKGK